VELEYRRPFRSVVGPDPLEYTRSVLDHVGEEMDSGFVPGDQFAIAPDV
jgi:hypothetical protein